MLIFSLSMPKRTLYMRSKLSYFSSSHISVYQLLEFTSLFDNATQNKGLYVYLKDVFSTILMKEEELKNWYDIEQIIV